MIKKPPAFRPGQRRIRRPLWIGGWPLFLLPLPLALKAIAALWRGDVDGLGTVSMLLAVLYLGAWLTRRGLVLASYRPDHIPFPFRSAGAVTVAIGTLATALFAGYDAIGAGAFGLVALFGAYLAYGFDRRTRAVIADDDVALALEAAYAKLETLRSAGHAMPTRDLRDQLGRIVAWGERILERIADDPEDIRRARKFLNVYLDGAQQVSQKFVRHQDGTPPQLEANYRILLGDMEAVCEEQYRRLQNDDLVDLDIQMEVLTTRLKREGVF